MKAKENTTYALIDSSFKISEIFTDKTYKEWNEDSIKAIELTQEQVEYVYIGMPINQDYTIPPIDLNFLKEQHLAYISQALSEEIESLREGKTQAEIETYQEQVSNARAYLETKDPSQATFLETLAIIRGMDLEELAHKVIEKASDYNTKYAKLLGNFRNLEAQIKEAKNVKALEKIIYTSPLEP